MLQYNGLTLAYIGDAVYEVYVREYLLSKAITKVNTLHKEAIKYTSANGQCEALTKLGTILTKEEQAIVKRGRNANSDRKPKNTDILTYKHATGFEALIGYLFLSKQEERLQTLMNIIFTD